MKILQIMSNCATESGVAQVIMRYYQYLHETITFDFLMFDKYKYNFEDEISAYGGKCYYVTRPSGLKAISFIREVHKFFNSHGHEYDAVQLHDLWLNSIILRIAKEKGIKVRIAHSHTTQYGESYLPKLRNKILYKTLTLYANVFFACSQESGTFAFGENIVANKNFFVINNAINISQYIYSGDNRTTIRQEFNIKVNDFVVGHVGRFSPQKNHYFLIQIFSQFCKRKPNAKLLLVGTGNGIRDIKNLCKELSIEDKVIFAGSRSDVGTIMSAMDVFCFPSIFEGLGNVLIEAQANGIACLTSDVVPAEAAILPSYRTLSLLCDANEWAVTLSKMSSERTFDAFAKVTAAGFNIVEEAEKVERMYTNIIR